MIRMLTHRHYPTIAYEVSWRIRAVVALRLQPLRTAPIHPVGA